MSECILITGIGGPAGRSALKYFKEKGFRVVGTDVRQVDEPADLFQIVPFANDPDYPTAILDMIRREEISLYVPTVTEELFVAATIAEEVNSLGCAVFISPPDAVRVANDKLETSRVLEEKGVAVPKTMGAETPRDKVLEEIGLPLLAKPCFSRGGRGVIVHRTVEDVYGENREGIVFQEFIPGTEYDVNLFKGSDGGVEASVVLRKTEMKEGIVGNAVSVERTEGENVGLVREVAHSAAEVLGMRGPLDIDVRLKDNGTPVILEINARLGGNVLHAVEVLDCLLGSYSEKRRKR